MKSSPQSVTMTCGRFSDWRTRSAGTRGLLIGGTAIVIAMFQIFDVVGLRINTSPSLPVGLYATTSDPAASLVEFCPDSPYGKLAVERDYRSSGSCADGGAPLLKPTIAKSGDIVDVSFAGLAVNGKRITNTAAMTADTKGRPLAAWPTGRYLVPRGQVWVASSFNSRSFDSRYFGPVPVAAIRDHVRPLITFGK